MFYTHSFTVVYYCCLVLKLDLFFFYKYRKYMQLVEEIEDETRAGRSKAEQIRQQRLQAENKKRERLRAELLKRKLEKEKLLKEKK